MDRATPTAQDLIDALIAFGDLKVWSVLVTIFGDMAPGEGESLPGPFLSGLTSRLGIRTEAQRVALHRLRKDGWIKVQRDGRVSLYGLSDLARAETQSVQSRVFDAQIPRPERCYIVLADPAGPSAKIDGVEIGGGAVLTIEPPKAPGLLVSELAVEDVPGWARDKAVPPGLQEDYERLLSLLADPLEVAGLTEPDRLALRVLVLHRWRRLVLSHNRTAAHLMGADWTGNTCRARVHAVLDALPRPVLPIAY